MLLAFCLFISIEMSLLLGIDCFCSVNGGLKATAAGERNVAYEDVSR